MWIEQIDNVTNIAKWVPITTQILSESRWLQKSIDLFLDDRRLCSGKTKRNRLCLNVGTQRVVNKYYCYLHRMP